jgi:hypothetical protein
MLRSRARSRSADIGLLQSLHLPLPAHVSSDAPPQPDGRRSLRCARTLTLTPHSFHEACATMLLRNARTCPACRQPIGAS